MSSARSISVAVGGCVLALAAGTLQGASADSPFDHVVGGVTNNPNGPNGALAHFSINAKSGPNGENPQGTFRIRVTSDGPPTQQYDATVTCMVVSGNLATVVGKIVRTKDFPRDGYTRVRIEDLGQGNGTEDRIQFGPYFGDPTVCPSPLEPDRDPITSGNLNVFDAS